jgi:hypothetical protein
MNKHIINNITIFILLFSVSGCDTNKNSLKMINVWPEYIISEKERAVALLSLCKYSKSNNHPKTAQTNYLTDGDFFNWGIAKSFSDGKSVKIEADGMPLVKYGDSFQYNPVTASQYALHKHGRFIRGLEDEKNFLQAIERIIKELDTDGAARYNFEWLYYLNSQPYQPGWVSAMAQGHILSVLSRAYRITSDKKYLVTGERVLSFMLKPIEKGGTTYNLQDLDPSLTNYPVFEEYIAEGKASYTLNGFIFALLGLYDWWQLFPNNNFGSHQLAHNNFDKGLETVKEILPYFEIGGFSAYDLSHITYDREPHIGLGYHTLHIDQLYALWSITGIKRFNDYYTRWDSYARLSKHLKCDEILKKK